MDNNIVAAMIEQAVKDFLSDPLPTSPEYPFFASSVDWLSDTAPRFLELKDGTQTDMSLPGLVRVVMGDETDLFLRTFARRLQKEMGYLIQPAHFSFDLQIKHERTKPMSKRSIKNDLRKELSDLVTELTTNGKLSWGDLESGVESDGSEFFRFSSELVLDSVTYVMCMQKLVPKVDDEVKKKPRTSYCLKVTTITDNGTYETEVRRHVGGIYSTIEAQKKAIGTNATLSSIVGNLSKALGGEEQE